MRVFCVVRYKGTNYYGWEKQVGQISVQEVLETAISKILNQPITIYGSGRTDAGVHAEGQTFHFDIEEEKYNEDELKYRLNCVLPNDIEIKELKYLKKEIHARFDAINKEYRYHLSLNAKDPFLYEFAWLLKTNTFDEELFISSLKQFEGKHNFINFTSKEEDKDNFIREIYSINVTTNEKHDDFIISLVGNGFMRYQIRFMIGTAVNIAIGKEDKNYIIDKLNNVEKRAIVVHKAPSQGLTLFKVNYK